MGYNNNMPIGYRPLTISDLAREYLPDPYIDNPDLQASQNGSVCLENRQYFPNANQQTPVQFQNTQTSQPTPSQDVCYSITKKVYVDYNPYEKSMTACSVKLTNKAIGNGSLFSNNPLIPNGKIQSNEFIQIAVGCAEFVALKKHLDEISEPNYCQLKISSKDNDEIIEIPCEEINNKSKSLKNRLGKYGINFTNNKCFEIWCNDISDRMNRCSDKTVVMPDFSFEDGKWQMNKHSTETLSFSEQNKILSSLFNRLSANTENSYAEITLILYGVIGKMYSVLKKEGFVDISGLLIVSPDIPFVCSRLKSIFQFADSEVIRSKGNPQKELNISLENRMPLILIDGSKYIVNKIVNEYSTISGANCLPIFVAGKLDDIAPNDRISDFFTITVDYAFGEDTKKIIDIFLEEIFGKNYLFDDIKQIAKILNEEGNFTCSFKKKNLFSLLLALEKMILSNIGMQNENYFCNFYANYLDQNNSNNLLDISKLKHILIDDPDYKRVMKNEVTEIKDNVLCIGDDVIFVNQNTMLSISKKFGFDSNNGFVSSLNESECLKTSGNSYMDVINLNGFTKRVYSFKLSSIFPFGEIRPSKEAIHDNLICDIPLGKTANEQEVSFPIIENENNSIFISGQSGCGKTNLCNIMAKEALKKRLAVVVIGMDMSIKDLTPTAKTLTVKDIEQHESWNDCTSDKIIKIVASGNDPGLLDSILESFFKYKKMQETPIPTMLLLDEIQDFTWEGDSIIKRMLRQGRKYNIIPVLSTQYLNSDNGTNINDAFKQINTFCCFKNAIYPKNLSKKYPQTQNCIENLDDYEAVIFGKADVNGKIADFPLKFKTEKFL